MVTNVAAQTFEFHMGKANAGAMVYGDAATLAGNHTTEGSNTSSLPTLDQVLGLYAANFGDASAGGSTVGAIQPITNTSSYNGYVAAENNNPSGWDTNLWTSAPAPSGHINLDLSSGYLVDRTDGTNLWIAPVL